MSPDCSARAEPVPYSKMDDPQTLNLYSYVRNNPLSGVDPDGHCGQQSSGNAQEGCSQVKVDAKVTEQPKIVVNQKQPDGTSKTGVKGTITDTITDKGKPVCVNRPDYGSKDNLIGCW